MKLRRIQNFIIDKELGYGAQAKVYRGYLEGTNQYLAIKEHSPIQTDEDNEYKRQKYEREVINIIGAQRGIIGCIGFFYDDRPDGKYYIVIQEYAEKGTLFDYLCYYNVFDKDIAISYCYQLISAIHYLHSLNIAHRDIKPGNILLDSQFNLRVCDFGLAVINRSKKKIKDNITGTIDYLPPEVLRGEEHDIFKSDVFQLGVNLCLIMTSIHPFDNQPCIDLHNHKLSDQYLNLLKDPNKFWQNIVEASYEDNQIMPQIDEEFKQLIATMLSDKPNKRPTMDEIFRYPYFQKMADQQRVQAYMTRLQNQAMTTNMQVEMVASKGVKEVTPKMGYYFIQLSPFEYSYHGDFKAIREYIQSVIVPSEFSFASDDIADDQDCLIEIRKDGVNYVFTLLFHSGILQILRPAGQLPKILKLQKQLMKVLFKLD